MRQEAAKKINTLEKQIEALRDKQEEIRHKEWEYEEAEEKRKWIKDNADSIPLCKSLVGNVFTFGDSVIQHHTDKENGVVTREYDYVNIYFAKIVSYRDKSKVCMTVRHMYSGDTYATINDNTEMFISLEKRGNDWMAYELGRSFLGKLHVLTDEELQEALAFWENRMPELARNAFIDQSENQWHCPTLDEYLKKLGKVAHSPSKDGDDAMASIFMLDSLGPLMKKAISTQSVVLYK